LQVKPQEMDYQLLVKLSKELPEQTVIYFHYYGEPLLYPHLKQALKMFDRQITSILTNGKLIVERYDDIVDNLDTLCISIFEDDPEQGEQFELIREFLQKKRHKKPHTVLKFIGEVDRTKYVPFAKYAVFTRRTLFQKRFEKVDTLPLTPEYGICSDFLFKPLINVNGDVSICCCFDPKRLGVLGNITEQSLFAILNSDKRKEWLEYHLNGERDKVPLCKTCQFWGITS